MLNPGKVLRLSRIIDPKDGRGVVVAADHGFMLGSIKGAFNLEETLRKVILGGPDAVLLSPGQASRLYHLFCGRKAPSILIRADWTNAFRTKKYALPSRKVVRAMAAEAKDALALGASGIVVYYFIGCRDEAEALNFELMASFARECNEIGLPFIVEPVPLGERVTGANYADLVSASIRMAVEVGADAIKAPYTGDIDTFKKAVDAAGEVPILILGGAKAATVRDALEVVAEALEAGASGVVYGRQVIQAEDPEAFVKSVRAVVHEGKSVGEALGTIRKGPIQLEIDAERCNGCLLCELACTFRHDGAFSLSRARLRIEGSEAGIYRPILCLLLLDPSHQPLCVEACGTGALTLNEAGRLQLAEDLCTGCGRCVEACPVGVILIHKERPVVCDMCGGLPQCAEWCPSGALRVKYS
ncbi:MAG: aldolase [Candidatus Bathyarchaeota archaeon B26-2]|nr:MAG: aldolase [Candidatus Bathyarchaeota archaeon B26-2]